MAITSENWLIISLIFFFQAEDGIRDHCVTGVQTCALPISFFSREGGVSTGIYQGLNAGVGSYDDPAHVAENRRRMAEQMGVEPAHFLTAHQIHSPDVVVATTPWDTNARPRADAIVTQIEGLSIGASAADCGPVLFVDPTA